MATFKDRSVLTGMTVSQAMQRVVISMPQTTPVLRCIRQMIKCKVDAVLVDNKRGVAQGVVSKTDLMGAFYGGLPRETPIQDIMMGPVQVCSPGDPIDQVLDQMKQNHIHQIYAKDPLGEGGVAGRLEYADIVGLLYRYCRQCKHSRRIPGDLEAGTLPRLRAKEVMTGRITDCKKTDTLYQVMELLSLGRLKAVPIVDGADQPLGIISKTDLVLAYVRGVMPQSPAKQIMNTPLASCGPDTLLSDLLLKMFVTDIGHLFCC